MDVVRWALQAEWKIVSNRVDSNNLRTFSLLVHRLVKVLVGILGIFKNPPMSRGNMVVYWVKNVNMKKSPNEIENNTENDG